MLGKPYAESAAQNQAPIFHVLQGAFAHSSAVLEIASGTGQHAVAFAARLPHLSWQPTDLAENLPGIQAWVDEARLANVQPPRALDITREPWSLPQQYDAVFNANTLHIISWEGVEAFFRGVGQVLKPGGLLALYGPFNYDGAFTSESNAQFDAWLKERDPESGVRDFEAIEFLAEGQGLTLEHDHAMPANNRTLVFRRGAGR